MRSDERRLPSGLFAGRHPGASYGLRPDRDTSPILEASHVHVRDASMGDMGIPISEQDQWDSGESDG
jgi:hypothetical protein